MAAEQLSTSLVSHLAIPRPPKTAQGYYRSKLFVAAHHSNPLIGAAAPLLSLLERLSISPSLPSMTHIHENIRHELNAFHSQIAASPYPDEHHAIANYMLCATIDELLGKSFLRVHGEVVTFAAFTPASMNDTGPEKRFFEIIHFIKDRPNQYLDLIELAYYCLISGFEGEEHLRPDGRQNLENLIEKLFGLIGQHRVNKSHRLFREVVAPPAKVASAKPLISTAIAAFILIIGTLVVSHSLIEQKAKTVLFGHTILAKLDN